ncbi:hypothetical protein ACGFIG_09310 [Micromonospora sp. NPDC049048]|uniref:hypothetical protein n=1 Tax=Micromonospora sp. NPDC049048 TaxID=3364263 RepID=UPI003715BD52
MSVQVHGAERFHLVARRLQGAADRKDLVRELRKGILDAVPELKEAVRQDAPAYLPDRYAAELVPSLRMTTSTSTGGSQVTVKITVTAKGAKGNSRQVATLEAGRLKHPVFGRTRPLKRHAKHRATSRLNPWVTQAVTPGFVTKPMLAGRPEVRREIEAAVDRVLNKITGA